ncbi:DNA-directed RNA polymerase [Candidatus Woesearchaeota archaeon]|nr:MAG: DNA-directed RNA polymerase [Candidatus Woesearchaeota archaeon]
MFYRTKIRDHIRIPPKLFGEPVPEALLRMIKEKYEGYISKELGVVIDVVKVYDYKEGIIIPGDGAAYYETDFEILNFVPEMKEVLIGRIRDIAEFGVFLNFGAMEGMVHISQAMDDYVQFNSKEKMIVGKETKKTLKIGDDCRARVIAISFKDITNPKLGLTMRQKGLGKLEWFEEEAPKKKSSGTKK